MNRRPVFPSRCAADQAAPRSRKIVPATSARFLLAEALRAATAGDTTTFQVERDQYIGGIIKPMNHNRRSSNYRDDEEGASEDRLF